MDDTKPEFETALAIADLLSYNEQLLDRVEGLLLIQAGKETPISPATVGIRSDLGREAAADLFRQLNEVEAVSRESYADPVVDSEFLVHSGRLRGLCGATRDAIRSVAAYHERHPRTEVVPLVTFPNDPVFEPVTPGDFGMESLMSTLASEIKRCNNRTVLLSPFFEGDGLARLTDVLLDALARGVEVTIVTRYLQDRTSHNWSVIHGFVDQAQDRGVSGKLETIDYTIWDSDIPPGDRRQNGSNPSFTLHAKMMLFDSRAAYIGSANVTDYGFGRYLELGVLLQGRKVSDVYNLCSFLLASNAAESVVLR
jgi:putative cardiolipin synthase